jgi:hypothetical protein
MNAGLDLLVEMILCEVSGVGTSASAVVGGRYGGLSPQTRYCGEESH